MRFVTAYLATVTALGALLGLALDPHHSNGGMFWGAAGVNLAFLTLCSVKRA